jgi:hypothetical protein
MKKLIAKIKCKLFSHNLRPVDVSETGSVEKVYCHRCKRYFGMNHSVKAFLLWDNELEQTFVLVNDRHSKSWPKERQWLK